MSSYSFRLEFYSSFKSDGEVFYGENEEENRITVHHDPDFVEFDPLVLRYDPNADNPRITIQVVLVIVI